MSENAINNIEAAEMAERAADEIESLRRTNAELAPKAHAYDTLATVPNLLPQRQQGYGVDLAAQLRRRAKQLRAPEDEAND